jgi:drug/metabolite transporter (DMT)-like permease
MAILLALISAVAIGGADFVGGRLTAKTSPVSVVAVAGCVDMVLLGLMSWITAADPSAVDLVWASAAGVVGALAFVAFLTALAIGPMTIISPFTALLGVATPFTAGLLAGERPSALAWGGCVLGVIAVGFASAARSHEDAPAPPRPSTLLLAGASGIGFGGFVILLEQTSQNSGVSPIVMARAVGVTLLFGIALMRKQPLLPAPGFRVKSLGMGILQSIATAALIEALHAGSLTLVGVVSSLYPVSTILLAWWLLDEHLDRIHTLGVALALAAVVLIAAG